MSDQITMTSNRPYLLRAFYQWILDNECTPYIVVEADLPHVDVPQQVVNDGQVVLNISPTAVQGLEMTNEHVTFNARFGGVPFDLYIPNYAISAIYARENGAGTMFPPEEIEAEMQADDFDESPELSVIDKENSDETKDENTGSEEKPKSKKGSHLSLVK